MEMPIKAHGYGRECPISAFVPSGPVINVSGWTCGWDFAYWAYVSGEVDPGLFVFTAQLLPSTTVEQAEAALLREIEILQTEKIDEYELEKIKNKFEANTLFGELNVMNKAMNLGFYEMLGDLPLINREVTIYRSQTAEQIADFSRRTFRPENRSTLIYRAKQ